MIAYTDAGFKGKDKTYSNHAYIIMNDNGKIIKKRRFRAFENSSMNAERRTIEKLLQDTIHMQLDVRGMVIYSDCKYLVETVNNEYDNGIECEYLKYLIKSLGCSLKFTSRRNNMRADRMVKQLKRPKIKKGLLIS